MNIRIEKKANKFLLLFSDGEKVVTGVYLDPSDFRKLYSDVQEVLNDGRDVSGDDI